MYKVAQGYTRDLLCQSMTVGKIVPTQPTIGRQMTSGVIQDLWSVSRNPFFEKPLNSRDC